MSSVSVASSAPVVSHAVAVPQGVPMPSRKYKDISFISSLSLGLGLSASPTGGTSVSSVHASSPAHAVPVGTKILAVNGQSCADMAKNDVVALAQAAKTAGPMLTITFDLIADDEEAEEETQI